MDFEDRFNCSILATEDPLLNVRIIAVYCLQVNDFNSCAVSAMNQLQIDEDLNYSKSFIEPNSSQHSDCINSILLNVQENALAAGNTELFSA